MQPTGLEDSTGSSLAENPYTQSIVGEYFRFFVMLVGAPLVIFWANQIPFTWQEVVCLAMSCGMMLVLIIPFGAGIIRSVIILGFAVTILVVCLLDLQVKGFEFDQTGVGQIVLLISLSLIGIFETIFFVVRACQTKRYLFLAWCLFACGFIVYAVAIPTFNVIQESLDVEKKNQNVVEEQTDVLEELKVRSAYYGIFSYFTFIGACIGSFLNVVAGSVSHGKSIAMRSSSCPSCNVKIKRFDNLPIYSYLNLSGRCRNCNVRIPIRYLVVEIVAGLIFGSLFMYELITGAANVPTFTHYFHAGILWMILYPKWDVIGIYAYHVTFMSTLLTLALIEWDGSKISKYACLGLCAVFSVPIFAYQVLQPVSVDSHIEFIGLELNATTELVLKVLIGGVVGTVCGFALKIFRVARNSHTIVAVCCISGIALGWQALVQLFAVFVLCVVFCLVVSPLRKLVGNRRMSSVWLAAVMIHHPCWKLIAGLW